jgi:branched-subunit amino acid transport protein
MTDLVFLILGMAFVTYVPRLILFIIISKLSISKRFEAFLKCVPYVALGALIIPGVFSVTPDVPVASLAGIGFAVLYGWLRGGMIVPVLGSVMVTFLVLFK